MPPELETLDQLLGGDMPVSVIRSLFPWEDRFVAAISAMLQSGEVRLFSEDTEVPDWKWKSILADCNAPSRLSITQLGAKRIG